MEKPTVFYVYDALCGWCYGFGLVIESFWETNRHQMQVQVLSGGMMRGSRVAPIAGMADYIRQASPRVTQLTGAVFSEAYHTQILDKGTYLSNSLPPAVALCILKEQNPDRQVPNAHAIQQLHYSQGLDLNEVATYLPLAIANGLTETDFEQKFSSDYYRQLAEQEFAQLQNWGISGFPAVVLQKGNQLYLVAQGYMPLPQLTDTINRILSEKSPAA